MSCIFCKIAGGEAPARIAYQDDELIAFHDIDQSTPLHLLVIPRRHVESAAELDDPGLAGRILMLAAKLGTDAGYRERGFRIVSNVPGPDNGPGVGHFHVHVFAGRPLGYPVGPARSAG